MLEQHSRIAVIGAGPSGLAAAKHAIVEALNEQIDRLRSRGEWQKLGCLELLFVRGWPNRDVAIQLKMSEQTVANFKFEFLARLRTLVRKQGLSEDVFPELQEND